MRAMALAVVAAGLLAGTGRAADPEPAVAVPETHKALQGVWKPESIKFQQAEMLPNQGAKDALALVIKGTEYRSYYCSNPKKGEYYRLFTAHLALDPATHTFELSVTDGQKKGEKRHGIYEHAGNKLTLCYGPADKPRPTSFDAPKGTEQFLETWLVDKR